MQKLAAIGLLVVAVANFLEVVLQLSSHTGHISPPISWWLAPIVIGTLSVVGAIWIFVGSGPLPSRSIVLYFIVWASLRVFLRPVDSDGGVGWPRTDLALFFSGAALFGSTLIWQYLQKHPNGSR